MWGKSAAGFASRSSKIRQGEVLDHSANFRAVVEHGVDVACDQIGLAVLRVDRRQVEEVIISRRLSDPSGKKEVMKLPWRCSQHLGGFSNIGLGASPKLVVAMEAAPAIDILVVEPDLGDNSMALFTSGEFELELAR